MRQKARNHHRLASLCAAAFLALPPAAAALPADPQDCGTVITEANNDVTTFNPLFASDLGNGRAAQLLFQPLVWINRHGQVDTTRSLAASIDVSPDTTTYTLTLRPWLWSDGVAVSAADVVYDWQMIGELGKDYPDYGAGGIPGEIKAVTALNPEQVRVVLTQPVNPQWFIDNGLAQLVPLPAHAWRGLSLDTLYQAQSEPRFFQAVDGPLMIKRLDPGLDAVYVPNPRYGGARLHLDRFILNFVHSDGAALQQVEAGDLDFAPVPLNLYAGAVHHPQGVHLARLSPVSFFYFLCPNLQNPHVAFFRDASVRDAIADAIDQNAIIRLVYHGFGEEVHTAIPPADAELLAPDLKAGGPVGYDPAKARALLAAAGFTPGPDGILQRHGQRLAFTALIGADSTEAVEMMVLIEAQLRGAGIDMKMQQIGFGQMMQEMQDAPQDWEAAELGTYPSSYPSGEGLFATGAGGNSGGYSDPRMDRLIDASVNQPGLAGLYAYEVYTAAQQPVIFIGTEDHLDLVSNRIHGVDAYGDGSLLAPDALYCSSAKSP